MRNEHHISTLGGTSGEGGSPRHPHSHASGGDHRSEPGFKIPPEPPKPPDKSLGGSPPDEQGSLHGEPLDKITTEPASTMRQDLLTHKGTVPKKVVNDKDTEPREKRRDLPPHAGTVTKKQKEDNPPEVSEGTGFPPDIFGSQLTIPLLSTTAKETQAAKPSLVSASYDESDSDGKENKNQRPGLRTEEKAKAQRNGKTANYQGPKKQKERKARKTAALDKVRSIQQYVWRRTGLANISHHNHGDQDTPHPTRKEAARNTPF